MLKLLDRAPLPFLAIGALLMGGAPFAPQPHLFEKLGMLGAGTLSRPIDIFDLCLHGFLPALLVLKLARVGQLLWQERAK
jgi:hypothetical protein